MNTSRKQPVYYLNGKEVYATEFEENKFPLEVFPKELVDLIRELHEKYEFPIEFSAGSLLVAFATAIGATIQLKFKRNFIVMSNLYCMIIGDSGSCKTHPLRFMFKPIEERKAMYQKEYLEKLEEYKIYENLSKKEKEGLERVTQPKQRLNTIEDFTLESLKKCLSENPRGISVVVDELAGFVKNLNRYNTGSDEENYNTLWSGTPINVNRVTTVPIYSPTTSVSIFGTIQPEVLYNFYSKDKAVNGLTARFLMIMPDNLLPINWHNEEINEDLIRQYHQAIQKLLDVELRFNENGVPVPTILEFTEEAQNRMIEWHNGIEFREKIIEEKGNTFFDAFVKLDTYALRFALILQLIYASVENNRSNKVGIRAAENAILLVNYFMKEVIKVHKFVYSKDIRIGMSDKQRELYENLTPKFSLCRTYDKAANFGFTKDMLKKFVKVEKYFKRIGHGEYEKIFNELSDE
jgi:hypothetical protein